MTKPIISDDAITYTGDDATLITNALEAAASFYERQAAGLPPKLAALFDDYGARLRRIANAAQCATAVTFRD